MASSGHELPPDKDLAEIVEIHLLTRKAIGHNGSTISTTSWIAMKMKYPAILPCYAFLLSSSPAWAQSEEAASAIEVNILSQKVTHQGGRSVTYNIVAPTPELLAFRPRPENVVQVTPLSPEELQALQVEPHKPIRSFIFEGATYSNGVTEFRWNDGALSFSAFSNVDFTLFPALTILESHNCIYQFTFLIQPSNTPSAEFPDASVFSNSQAEYLTVAGQEQQEAAFTPIDALHVYFDSAKAELVASRNAALVAQAAREQELRESPPQPKDVTHNFWPIKSTLRPNGD
jgi:hypothetical protein